MRVVTKEQMKRIEQESLSYDLTFHRLMENAGSAAAAFIRRTFQVGDLGCMVFCGAGNNGGDGLVVARKLSESGANVLVVLTDGAPAGEEAAAMHATAEMMQLPIAMWAQSREKILEHLPHIDIIVDAIYGTGFHGKLDEAHAEICAAINGAIAAVVALDIPTGVECDTGRADENAVRADFTVAFDSLKPLHVIPSSLALCGVIELADIGIPEEAHGDLAVNFGSLTTEQVFSHLPHRTADSHKGDFGRLLCVCGAARYRGAAALAALGALRCGAGMVTVASTEPVCAAVAAHVLEATFLPLGEAEQGCIDSESAAALLPAALESATAVLFGCGLQNTPHAARILSFLLRNAPCPLVIDADGINALSGNIHLLREAKAPVILTPHPGEMARLCGTDTAEIQRDRFSAAMQFAREHGVVLTLKGAQTLTALPDGGVYINRTGNPGLAKAGSGDILAGMIGALLAQGIAPTLAAACAVHLHGLAADATAARFSQYGMLPSELLRDLTEVFSANGR